MPKDMEDVRKGVYGVVPPAPTIEDEIIMVSTKGYGKLFAKIKHLRLPKCKFFGRPFITWAVGEPADDLFPKGQIPCDQIITISNVSRDILLYRS